MVWLALILALLLVVASVLYVTLRGLEVFRAFKSVSRRLGSELDRFAAAGEEAERHLSLAGEGGERLTASLDRLSRSRARLNVLRTALDDAQAAAGRITSVYPRK